MGHLDCLLVRLPEDQIGFYRFSESLGVGYVAAVLRRAGYEVEIADGALDHLSGDEITQRILQRQPDLVGFSILFDGYRLAQGIARDLRRSGFTGHLTMGQHFATFNAERILRDTTEIDSVVCYEGEETALELLRAVQARGPLDGIQGLVYRSEAGVIVSTTPRPLLADLDSLPFPARDVLARNQNRVTTVNISGSRGCPWRCKFCTISTFYRVPKGSIWRHRSPENIVDEMEQISAEFGPRPFFFVDDQFMGGGNAGRKFARELAAEILRRGFQVKFSIETRADTIDRESLTLLKQAGLQLVFIGIESGYQPTLDLYQKDITVEENMAAIKLLQELTIDIQMGFIMFHEGTTFEEVRTNLDFLEEADAFDVVPFFNQLKIHAGSAFMPEGCDDELTPDYQQPWEISDPRVREFRDALHRALLPLTVPAYLLRIDRRFLASLQAAELARFERRQRQAFLAASTELLAAAEEDRLTPDLVDRLLRWSETEAKRLESDIEVSRLVGGPAQA